MSWTRAHPGHRDVTTWKALSARCPCRSTCDTGHATLPPRPRPCSQKEAHATPYVHAFPRRTCATCGNTVRRRSHRRWLRTPSMASLRCRVSPLRIDARAPLVVAGPQYFWPVACCTPVQDRAAPSDRCAPSSAHFFFFYEACHSVFCPLFFPHAHCLPLSRARKKNQKGNTHTETQGAGTMRAAHCPSHNAVKGEKERERDVEVEPTQVACTYNARHPFFFLFQ